MSQSDPSDREKGENTNDDNQSLQLKEPVFVDSSGPFFTLYSEAAEDEDNKMVKSWQDDAKGILIFTGLFSAAIAALLTVTAQDLRPNSQDTSAFYLGNIYEVLADPNATRASPLTKSPPFSRPRYAIWTNSLMFLSLVMNLSCALLATSLQQWARRYIRLTQPARRGPEKRARMRAFYADGVDKMHIPWAVEGLPTLLHLLMFLFFAGLAIFLFNVDVEVFTCVVSWIGLFIIVYGWITLLPLIRHDSPYYTPLSRPVWFVSASIRFVTCATLYFFSHVLPFLSRTRRRVDWHYAYQIFRGMEKEAEEMVEKQSSEIDARILDWTISDLGDYNSQEKFFQTIPGFFSSKLVENLKKIPRSLLFDFWRALNTFIRHAKNSNSLSKEVESRRVDIGKDIASIIPCSFFSCLDDYNPPSVSIDRVELMTRWFYHESPFVSCAARVRAADMLGRMEERDGHWIVFAHQVSGLSEHELRIGVTLARDNMLLATVIETCRRIFQLPRHEFADEMDGFIHGFGKFEICRTLPRLQHDFCKMWNELVQEAMKPESRHLASSWILNEIRGHYISLHQGTDATLTDFYPLCDIASHHPDSTTPVPVLDYPIPTQSDHSPDAPPPTHRFTPGGGTVSRQVEEAITAGSPSRLHPTTPTIIRDNFQAPAATDSEPALQVHTSSHLSDASPPGAALQHNPLATAHGIQTSQSRSARIHRSRAKRVEDHGGG